MNDTADEKTKLSWWRRLSGGLKRTSSSLGSAVADLVTKRKLDRAMLEDIEDVLLRADLGTEVAARIAEAVGSGRYDKAISADEVKSVVATEESPAASVAASTCAGALVTVKSGATSWSMVIRSCSGSAVDSDGEAPPHAPRAIAVTTAAVAPPLPPPAGRTGLTRAAAR